MNLTAQLTAHPLFYCYRSNRNPRIEVSVHSIVELERLDFKFHEGINWCVEAHWRYVLVRIYIRSASVGKEFGGKLKLMLKIGFQWPWEADLTAQSVSQKQILVLWYDDDRFVDNLYYPFIRIRGWQLTRTYRCF